jgi:hypothetical protein
MPDQAPNIEVGRGGGRLKYDKARRTIVSEPLVPEQMKRDKLADILRRVVANPGNVPEVAEQIAQDWFPKFKIDKDGRAEIVVGDGKHR